MPRFVMALALIAGGCGDNSADCGAGTTNVDNVCIPSGACGTGTVFDPTTHTCLPDGSVVCVDGTKFDPALGACVIDPSSCQNGTVLVNGVCADPTAALVIDVEEGPEPNGLGIIEDSTTPAGLVVALKDVGGSGVVLHGHIAPFRDADGDGLLDPDVDTYRITVASPTLVKITADGVHGTLGAFAVFADVGSDDPLFEYLRVGLSLTGDMSKRQLFLPRAGQYLLVIGDSRTFYQYTTGGPIDAAPGDGEYYVTIDQMSPPTPTPLTVASNVAIDSGVFASDETKFYAVAAGTGVNRVTLGMPYAQSRASVAAMRAGTFQSLAAGGAGGATAQLLVGGTASVVVVVADPVYNTASEPVPFTLKVETSDAIALPLDGSAITPVIERGNTPLANLGSLFGYNAFYFDTTLPNEVIGIELTWSHPVHGGLVDDHISSTVAAFFTGWVGGAGTWTTYKGLVHVPTAGRYYFVVYDPTGTPGATTLGVTSRIQVMTVQSIALGTPTGPQPLDANFQAAVFDYDAGTVQPWQLFDLVGVNTGGQALRLASSTTYGRIDLQPSAELATGVELFEHDYAEGGGAVGRILLDDPSTHYLVVVHAATVGGGQTVDARVTSRAFTDLGTVATNASASSTGHTLDATNTPTYFLCHASEGDHVTTTVHPQVPGSLDTRFVRLDAAEQPVTAPIDTTSNGDDTEVFVQGLGAWTAFVVSATTPPASAQLYDVSVSAAP